MGYDVFAGWGEEATWAMLIARAEFARVYEDSVADHEAPIANITTLGRRDVEHSFKQTEKGTVSLVQPLLYDGMGLILKHALGIVATTGAGPYVHTYTLEENPYTRSTTPLKGLSLELHAGLPDSGLQSLILHGARCRSLGMSIRTDEEIKVTTDWVGQQVKQLIKSGAPTYLTEAEIVKPKSVAVQLDAGSIDVYGVDFTLSNNLRDDKAILGSPYIKEPRAIGMREITGTIDKEWIDKTFYDKFIASTSAALIVTATGGSGRVTTITLNNLRLTGKTPGVSDGEELDYQLPFTAFYDATNTALKIQQDNVTATPLTDP